MADRVGQQLGHYRLLSLIGEGGFAQVYLGEHIHLGMQAAVKVLHARLASDDIAQFRAEARTIARLVHPHIVRVLDFGIEEHVPNLVMDYAPNGTLRTRHPKGEQVPLASVVSYVKQIADALQYAHDEHLVHRDIKPENMLLDRHDAILLSDFGLALVAQSSRSQNPQDIAGTVAYMAPEQIEGHPRPASDQYALGVVVYEWLTGERPFSGSYTEIVAKHALLAPPSLQARRPTLSPAVEAVVLRALAKDPKERFASVRAFAAALEEASQPDQAREEALLPTQGEQPAPDGGPSDLPPVSSGSLPTLPAAQRFVAPSEMPEARPSWLQRWQRGSSQPQGSAASALTFQPARRATRMLLAALIAVVLIVGIAGVVFFAHKSGVPAVQATPTIDRHGLQTNVPLPDRFTFKARATNTSGNTPIDEWFWTVASPDDPATVKTFYQKQLPNNGWTHIQVFPIQNGALVVACQNGQVMGTLANTSVQVTNNQGKVIQIITAPAGGSALEILLTSDRNLVKTFCLNQTPTPTR